MFTLVDATCLHTAMFKEPKCGLTAASLTLNSLRMRFFHFKKHIPSNEENYSVGKQQRLWDISFVKTYLSHGVFINGEKSGTEGGYATQEQRTFSPLLSALAASTGWLAFTEGGLRLKRWWFVGEF